MNSTRGKKNPLKSRGLVNMKEMPERCLFSRRHLDMLKVEIPRSHFRSRKKMSNLENLSVQFKTEKELREVSSLLLLPEGWSKSINLL